METIIKNFNSVFKYIFIYILFSVFAQSTINLALANKNKLETSAKNHSNYKDNEDKKVNAKITKPWARLPIPPNNNTAIYFSIENLGDKQIDILSADSPNFAQTVEIHNSYVDQDGVGHMTKVDRITIPPRTIVNFKPHSTHIMLLNLKKTLKEGDIVEITLYVRGSKEIKVNAVVSKTQ